MIQTVRIVRDLAGERAGQLGRALVFRGANAALMAVPVGVVAVLVRDLQQGGISAARAWTVTAILVAGLLAQLALAIRANAVLWISSYQAGRDLRTRLLDHVQRLPIGFHSHRQAGDTLTALARDPRELESFLGWSLPSLAADIVLPAAVIGILVVVDPVTAAAVAVAVLASLPVLRWTLRRYARFASDRQELQADTVSRIVEHVQGIAVIRACNQAGARNGQLSRALEEFRAADRTILKAVVPAYYVFATVLGLGLPLTLMVGCYQLLTGRVDTGDLIIFLVLSLRVYHPLLDIASYTESLPLVAASLRRIVTLLAAPALTESALPRATERFDVSFEQVSFGYPGSGTVLSELSFSAPEGGVTALVGPSGAGKTTVLSLIARFWDPQAGSVRIGGVDIRELGADGLSRAISVVFQEPYLFQGSIADNIAAGRPDADRQAVLDAGSRAACDQVAASLPGGYDALVGEGGTALSTGERQRVALARAILKDAPIVLLDEATAALDPVNEALISRALATLGAGKTLIVVAHRLSTVRYADQILVLRNGGIAERGTHDELLEHGGMYARFWFERQRAAGWRLGG